MDSKNLFWCFSLLQVMSSSGGINQYLERAKYWWPYSYYGSSKYWLGLPGSDTNPLFVTGWSIKKGTKNYILFWDCVRNRRCSWMPARCHPHHILSLKLSIAQRSYQVSTYCRSAKSLPLHHNLSDCTTSVSRTPSLLQGLTTIEIGMTKSTSPTLQGALPPRRSMVSFFS